jgi:ketosteroid isomerase-like protein
MDSHNLSRIRELWRVYEREGQDAGIEALLEICHDDAEFGFYAMNGKILRGGDELRAFYRDTDASIRAAPYDFKEEGDKVVVTGWVRVLRPGGALADAQVQWEYVFREGRIAELHYAPLAAEERD